MTAVSWKQAVRYSCSGRGWGEENDIFHYLLHDVLSLIWPRFSDSSSLLSHCRLIRHPLVCVSLSTQQLHTKILSRITHLFMDAFRTSDTIRESGHVTNMWTQDQRSLFCPITGSWPSHSTDLFIRLIVLYGLPVIIPLPGLMMKSC